MRNLVISSIFLSGLLFGGAASAEAPAAEPAATTDKASSPKPWTGPIAPYPLPPVETPQELPARLREVLEAYKSARTAKELVQLSLAVDRLMEQLYDGKMWFALPPDATGHEAELRELFDESELKEEIGIGHNHLGGVLVYNHQLLREAHALGPEPELLPYTLFGMIEPDEGFYVGAGSTPDLQLAEDYYQRFPKGPYIEKVLYKLGMMYSDLYAFLTLREQVVEKFSADAAVLFEAVMGEMEQPPTAQEAKAKALKYLRELLERFPETRYPEYVQERIDDVRQGRVGNLYYYSDC